MSAPDPPPHLSEPAAAWWQSVVNEFEFEPHQWPLLEAAADAYMRMIDARDLVLTEGQVVLDRYEKPKAHPAVAIERDSRLALARLVRELALDVPVDVPRRGGVAW